MEVFKTPNGNRITLASSVVCTIIMQKNLLQVAYVVGDKLVSQVNTWSRINNFSGNSSTLLHSWYKLHIKRMLFEYLRFTVCFRMTKTSLILEIICSFSSSECHWL